MRGENPMHDSETAYTQCMRGENPMHTSETTCTRGEHPMHLILAVRAAAAVIEEDGIGDDSEHSEDGIGNGDR
jgi:hypothetical protein